MSNQTTFETLADGLEALADGRGWSTEHEKARVLANAAPKLFEALRVAIVCFEKRDYPRTYKLALEALKEVEQSL